MTICDKLDELEHNNQLKPLVRNGVIPSKILMYYTAYKNFEFEKQSLNNCKGCTSIAVTHVADKMKVAEMTIYRAIKVMRSPIQ